MEEPNDSQAVKEYREAFHEFFKDKPKPKDEEEHNERLKEFFNWYNNVRKQSDTGKTPAEMYKKLYGKDAAEPVDLTDEEDINEEEEMRKFFDKEFWSKMKKDLKEATKKEACFLCFFAGTETARNMIEEEMKHAQESIEKMTPEEITKMMKK